MTQTTQEFHENKQSMNALSTSMLDCIADCLECVETCNSTLNHCLSMGGKHVETEHIKTMIACADICALSAQWMGREFKFHTDLCRTCAEVCKACAESCDKIGADDEKMQDCVDACRACAESCAKMSSH